MKSINKTFDLLHKFDEQLALSVDPLLDVQRN